MSFEIVVGMVVPAVIGLAGASMILAKKNIGVIIGGGLLLVAIVWLSNSIGTDESTSYVLAAGAIALLFGLLGLTAVGSAMKSKNAIKIVVGGLVVYFALVAGNYFVGKSGVELLFGLFGPAEHSLYAAAITTVVLVVLAAMAASAAITGRNIGSLLVAVALGGLAFVAGNYFVDNDGWSLINGISIPQDAFDLDEKLEDVGDMLEELGNSSSTG